MSNREPNQWGLIAEGHLGGYVPGGDPLSFYPELWDWLIGFEIASMVDVGCGEGHALAYFRDRGIDVRGIDGLPQDDPTIVVHDYTAGPLHLLYRADLVWSCEFVEHVEEQFIPNFLTTFQGARLLLMTHAVPGQPGHHHVNCRDSSYWIETMEAAGHRFDVDLTEDARALCAPESYFAKTGLAFRGA